MKNCLLARDIRKMTLAVLLSMTAAAHSEPVRSLLPLFGTEGEEFTIKTQKGHVVKGWLPTGWNDNSEWAAISATYEKLEDFSLEDFPDDAFGVLRIKLTAMDDDGQLQVTSYAGERIYEKGKRYRGFGWVRSPEAHEVVVTVRQSKEPYEEYAKLDVATDNHWKPFELNFEPDRDFKAIVMLAMHEVGTLDLSTVTVAEGGPGKSLLPPFGTEGADFSTPSAKGNLIHGWLPKDWVDNSEWAPVTATYTRLKDGPSDTLSALRIKLEKVGDGGQLQLTAYGEEVNYEPGKEYRIAGWVRSVDRRGLTVGMRQADEPYASYHEGPISTEPGWKRFNFPFKAGKMIKPIVMFVIKEPGTVDLAGITVREAE